jgi:hypothetical protein
MTNTRPIVLAATGVVLIAVLAGCTTPNAGEPPSRTVAASSPTPAPTLSLSDIEHGQVLSDIDANNVKRDFVAMLGAGFDIYRTLDGTNVVLAEDADTVPRVVLEDGARRMKKAAHSSHDSGDEVATDVWFGLRDWQASTGHPAVWVGRVHVAIAPAYEVEDWVWTVSFYAHGGVHPQFGSRAAALAWAENFVEQQPEQERWVLLETKK